MRVKICGITRLEDALICEKLGADAIGYIFYGKSKRYIKPEDSRKISEKLSSFITKVGVFVNESAETINNISKVAGLNAVQLQGDESVEFLKQINVPVIKGFRVDDNFDFGILNTYKDYGMLLDSRSENEYGGTGHTFNWEKIPAEFKHKIILAGGVSSDNIEFIMKEIDPAAVDISSSLEVSPGIKDHNEIIKFINKINDYRIKYADIT